MNQKGFAPILLIIIIVLVVIIGGILYLQSTGVLIRQPYPMDRVVELTPDEATKMNLPLHPAPSLWNIYIHPQLNLDIKYPSSVSVFSSDSETVVFVESQYKDFKMRDGPLPGVSLQIYGRNDKTPLEGLRTECSTCTFMPVKFNNAQGIKVTSGLSGENYYLTDTNNTGPVIRLFIQNQSNGNLALFEQMVQTLQFTR